MKTLNVVFEAPTRWDYFTIKRYLNQRVPVWVVEPFHTYHHRKGFRFYPPPLPDFVDRMIKKGEINLLHANQLNAREIYRLAADSSVNSVESVYSTYKKEYKDLFKYVCKVLKSPKAENIFKKNLCDKLAEFYSLNILLHRVEKVLAPGPIMAYTSTSVDYYCFLKSLIPRSNQDFCEHLNIRFPLRKRVKAFFVNLKTYLISVSRLSAQTLAAGLSSAFRTVSGKGTKKFSYGITVLSPLRQLSKNRRGPDFLVDNKKICAEDVVYLPLAELTGKQKAQLVNMPGEVYCLPKTRRCFSHYSEWKDLLRLALKKDLLFRSEEINTACSAFINYFLWLDVMENIEIKHFITHSDFGINHIGRNLALEQSGVETWYFTDSMNHVCNYSRNDIKHPFWTYMCYDNLVTWDELLARYFKKHPGSFRESHVVGCLWSEHITGKDEGLCREYGLSSSEMKNSFILAAFDSTYSRNGLTSYAEGVAFAEHLLKLSDEFPDIYLLFKEKKQRSIHRVLDPLLGPVLLDLYSKMDSHPRIKTHSDKDDSSDLISISDMVVSFPFTSTTFEALSANKPAVWHDPLDYYSDTPYAKAGGVMTHGYEELKKKVIEIKSLEPGAYRNPFQNNSPLMDPYRDGKAIDRFRDLLINGYMTNNVKTYGEKRSVQV